jgi:hypothetical protein
MIVYSTDLHTQRKIVLKGGILPSELQHKYKELVLEYYKAKYKSPFMLIRRFLRIVDKFGYSASVENSHSFISNGLNLESYYVFFNKKGHRSFKFRISNHNLSNRNQLPGGCVFQVSTLDSLVKDFKSAIEMLRKMSSSDYDKLWTNRYISELYN